MKPNIHPENYRTVLFFDSGANEGWLIRSCADTHGKTMVWQSRWRVFAVLSEDKTCIICPSLKSSSCLGNVAGTCWRGLRC